ncbi:hypothetical protein DV515_00017751, partial [Chloebia gouldiae]
IFSLFSSPLPRFDALGVVSSPGAGGEFQAAGIPVGEGRPWPPTARREFGIRPWSRGFSWTRIWDPTGTSTSPPSPRSRMTFFPTPSRNASPQSPPGCTTPSWLPFPWPCSWPCPSWSSAAGSTGTAGTASRDSS